MNISHNFKSSEFVNMEQLRDEKLVNDINECKMEENKEQIICKSEVETEYDDSNSFEFVNAEQFQNPEESHEVKIEENSINSVTIKKEEMCFDSEINVCDTEKVSNNFYEENIEKSESNDATVTETYFVAIKNEAFSESSEANNKKNEKRFKCTICDRAFKHKSDLIRHMCTHPSDGPYQCEICEKRFAESIYLKYHVRLHVTNPRKCHMCEKTFNYSSELARHVRTHTNERPYQCTLCDKSFVQENHLKTHIRIHTNNKPYLCEICKKTFNSNDHYKYHMRTHSNDKPYKCKFCERAFVAVGTLNDHMRKHTNERPFGCKLCDKTFTQSGTLRNHLRLHTGERPYQCQICKKTFNQNGSYRKHMRAVHASDTDKNTHK